MHFPRITHVCIVHKSIVDVNKDPPPSFYEKPAITLMLKKIVKGIGVVYQESTIFKNRFDLENKRSLEMKTRIIQI